MLIIFLDICYIIAFFNIEKYFRNKAWLKLLRLIVLKISWISYIQALYMYIIIFGSLGETKEIEMPEG